MTNKYPVVTGNYQMTSEWSINLLGEYLKRIDDENLVFWNKDITLYIAIWDNGGNCKKDTLSWIKKESNSKPLEKYEFEQDGNTYFGYLLLEHENSEDRWAMYSYTIGTDSYVQMAFYFSDRKNLEIVKKIWLSLHEKK